MYSNGEWGTEGSYWKVTDARKGRGFQDAIGRTLAEIVNKGRENL